SRRAKGWTGRNKSGPLRLEEPVPRRRVFLQLAAAAELLPGQQHLAEADAAKTGAAKPVADLERLPEMLLQTAVAELAEGEIVERVLAVVGGVLPCLVEGHAGGQRAVHQEHGVVVHRVHRRDDADEATARTKDQPHLPQAFL